MSGETHGKRILLSSIVERIRSRADKGVGEEFLEGTRHTNEIPDPLTLIDISKKADVPLDWLLYGGAEERSESRQPRSKGAINPPPVNLVLRQPALAEFKSAFGGSYLTKIVRDVIATWETDGTPGNAAETIAGLAASRIGASRLAGRDYVNATGIIVHTGWGNAPLPASARERLMESAGATPTGAANMEGRTEICDRMLRALSTAECATVTTSNAASLLLVGGALAAGREIVVAARDLVEISEGARIRDIVEASGARIVAVGAANRVSIEDFRRAVTPETAVLLRSHTSNISVVGYVEHVSTSALANLARERSLACVVNLGGGSLIDLRECGLPECPTLSQAIGEDADLVLASGDKIIGGPQAGIVVGKKMLVDRLMRHPLARTCRPGKLTLAALEATLASYIAGRAWDDIPALRLLGADVSSLRERARGLAGGLRQRGYEATDAEDRAQCGGAVLPGVELPTWTVHIKHARFTDEELHALLFARRLVARRGHGAVVVDLRSILPEDDRRLSRALGIENSR